MANQIIDKALAWIGENLLVDYVTEQGTTTHATTGTWYYRKWKSGKIEAWNDYNIGEIQINFSGQGFGGYRSEQIVIPVPTDIFNGTPSGCTITKRGTQGGWVSNATLSANSLQTYLCCEASKTLTSQHIITYSWKN